MDAGCLRCICCTAVGLLASGARLRFGAPGAEEFDGDGEGTPEPLRDLDMAMGCAGL